MAKKLVRTTIEHCSESPYGMSGPIVEPEVDKTKNTISDCRWKTYGCASAIASTSILSEMVKGMPLAEAYRISPKDVTAKLGGLPEHKIHCSVLAADALQKAIAKLPYYLLNSRNINNIRS